MYKRMQPGKTRKGESVFLRWLFEAGYNRKQIAVNMGMNITAFNKLIRKQAKLTDKHKQLIADMLPDKTVHDLNNHIIECNYTRLKRKAKKELEKEKQRKIEEANKRSWLEDI